MLSLCGWLLALASVFAWSWTLGPEFGVTYAFIVFMFLVWIKVSLGIKRQNRMDQSSQRGYKPLSLPDGSSLLKHTTRFSLSVPVAGVLAMMLSVALVLFLPWSMLHKVAAAIFLYPVLWGAVSAWVCAQEKLLKPSLAILTLFVITVGVLLV